MRQCLQRERLPQSGAILWQKPPEAILLRAGSDEYVKELIVQIKVEITAEKERLKAQKQAG